MTPQAMPAIRQDAGPLTLHRKPLPALTGIRFLAAIQVVMFHFGAAYAQRRGMHWTVTNFLEGGWTAVTLFFMLSGFILSYTYAGQISKKGGRVRFWEARFARIYPVYLLSLLLCWPFNGRPGFGLSVAVFTMVQGWNPFHVKYEGAWNMPAWTLSMEAFFYLLFPFLLPFVERCSMRVLKILAVLTLLLIALGHTMTSAIEPLCRLTGLPHPVFRFPEFFAGMTLGLIFLRSNHRKRHSIVTYLAIGAILALLVLVKGPWLSLLVIPFAVLIYELAMGESMLAQLLGTRALLLLGGASYSVYLLQEPVRSWVHLAVTGSWELNTGKGGIDAFLSPVILVLFAIGVFLFWEEPARKWLRSWFKRRTQGTPSAA